MWSLLYAVPGPAGIVRPMHTYTGRLSPAAFNLLIHLGYLLPVIAIVPLPVLNMRQLRRSNALFDALKIAVQAFDDADTTSRASLVANITSAIGELLRVQATILSLWIRTSIVFVAVVVFNILAHTLPSILIIRALSRQVSVLSAVLTPRPRRSPRDRPGTPSSNGSSSRFLAFLPSIKIGTPPPEVLLSAEQTMVMSGDLQGNVELLRERRGQLRLLRRYRVNVIWQALSVVAIQLSYLTVNASIGTLYLSRLTHHADARSFNSTQLRTRMECQRERRCQRASSCCTRGKDAPSHSDLASSSASCVSFILLKPSSC